MADAGWQLDAGTSGCLMGADLTTCRGGAVVGPGDGGPTLTLDDGSVFTWVTDAGVITPPSLMVGERVAVEVTFLSWKSNPYGPIENQKRVTVTRPDGGQPLWVSRGGSGLSELDASESLALFGLAFTTRPNCSAAGTDICREWTRTSFDHLVQTSPVTVIPPLTRTMVASPSGRWEVLWASSADVETKVILCGDYVAPPGDLVFIGSYQGP